MVGNTRLNNLSLFFYNKTRLWLVGLFLVLIVLEFLSLPAFEEFLQIDENTISLDKPQIYSPDKVHEILTEWGDSGRLKQFWLHITWDLLLPIMYFFFLGFLISLLSKRGFSRGSNLQYLNLVSLVAVVDQLENISLFVLIFVYPVKISVFCWLKTGFTLIKYYIFGPAILFALVFAAIFAVKNKFEVQE